MGRKLFDGRSEAETNEDAVPDMTPARFDILYLIHSAGPTGPLAQRTLWERLGLHPSTISKALTRLRQLGLVASGYRGGCRRNKMVWLTPEGRQRIRRALHLVLTGRAISRHIRRFALKYVARQTKRGLTRRIDEALSAIWKQTTLFARHLGDTSDLVHVNRSVRADELETPESIAPPKRDLSSDEPDRIHRVVPSSDSC